MLGPEPSLGRGEVGGRRRVRVEWARGRRLSAPCPNGAESSDP